MTLHGFAIDVLDSQGSPRRDLSVEAAAQRYLDDRNLHPPGWRCLPLPENPRAVGDRPVLEVNLSESTFEQLTAEAASQGVSLDALVSHALMYAWASERTPVPSPAPSAGSARRRSTGPARSDNRSRT